MKSNKIILAVLILSMIVLIFSGCGGVNPVTPPIDEIDDDEEELKFWDGEFSTYQWERKDGEEAPGPNYYSNSIDNVWKDDQGNLHLRIIKRDNKWYCAEIYSEKEGWGYGKYTFDIEAVITKIEDQNGNISYVNDLDENIVIGLYTYDVSSTADKSRNELDIEFARWGDTNNDLGNFAVWYDSKSGDEGGTYKRNHYSFPIDLGDNSIHSFEWTDSNIVFYSSEMTFCPLYPESFDYKEGDDTVGPSGEGYGYIPIPNKERVYMNIWLFKGNPPANSSIREVEVIIKSFQFTAIVTEPPSVSASNKIFLESGGNLNGTSINPSNPTLTVNTGQSITGMLNVQAIYSGTSGNVVPFGYTPSWGSHSSSYVTVKSDLPVGTSTYNVSIDLNAPTTSGTYYLIFASNCEMNLGWTMSQTNWTTGTTSWNDGNDIADLTESKLDNSLSTGYLSLDMLVGSSYQTSTYGIAYVKIIVTEGSPVEEDDTYSLCDIGPAGGYIFYDKGIYSDGWRYLEAAPVSTEWTDKEWGSWSTLSAWGTLIGGTGTGIGTGQSNTTKIVTWLNSHGETGCAAQLCDALVYGGYSDWFLPSKYELNLMRKNLYLEGVGGFADNFYWSSSEYDANQAWAQYFLIGFQYDDTKPTDLRVRAVRAF